MKKIYVLEQQEYTNPISGLNKTDEISIEIIDKGTISMECNNQRMYVPLSELKYFLKEISLATKE